MKTILSVIGTRPEAIKMAPLINHLKSQNDWALSIVCSTGQHKEMLDQSLSFFEIIPDYNLNIMKAGQSLADTTAKILRETVSIFEKVKPDIVLVHGDTTTAFASSLAAFYTGIPLGHVEAGLRTNNIKSPFPEEFNRRIVGLLGTLHFSPTQTSCQNLLSEGVGLENIYVTGNTVIDSLLYSIKKINSNATLKNNLYQSLFKILKFDFMNQKFVLVTAHRRENFGNGIEQICLSLRQLAQKYQDINFVFPVHMNPKIAIPINKLLNSIRNIRLIEPLDYEQFVLLMNSSYFLLTDSGGIQEEAPSLGKPVLVMREHTERPEALQAGTVRLVGSDANKIFNGVSDLLESEFLYSKMSKVHNPYGDGKASFKIVEILKKYLNHE